MGRGPGTVVRRTVPRRQRVLRHGAGCARSDRCRDGDRLWPGQRPAGAGGPQRGGAASDGGALRASARRGTGRHRRRPGPAGGPARAGGGGAGGPCRSDAGGGWRLRYGQVDTGASGGRSGESGTRDRVHRRSRRARPGSVCAARRGGVRLRAASSAGRHGPGRHRLRRRSEPWPQSRGGGAHRTRGRVHPPAARRIRHRAVTGSDVGRRGTAAGTGPGVVRRRPCAGARRRHLQPGLAHRAAGDQRHGRRARRPYPAGGRPSGRHGRPSRPGRLARRGTDTRARSAYLVVDRRRLPGAVRRWGTAADRGAGPVSGWRLLHRELAARRRPLLAVLAWSALQAAPAIGTGVFLAWSIDRGFLAGNLVVGFGWLVAIGVLAVAARLAQRQTFGHLADVVEPLRDNLTRLVVSSTIRTAVDDGRSTDLSGAARITGQVETVRNVVSALLRSVNGMGLSMLAAAVGLATLAPAILLVVAPCLGAAFVLFGFVVRMLYTRRQALVLAEESVAASADHVLAGARDVDALQAHQQALGEIEQAIDEAARSARVLASVGLLNSVVILIGGPHSPLPVLLAAPSLIGTGHLEAGVVLGAVTYLRGQLMGGGRSGLGGGSRRGVAIRRPP